jgi:hypothetical protein
LSPPLITPAVTPSTENAPNNVNTGSRQVTPVPAIHKASLPASPSEKTGMNNLNTFCYKILSGVQPCQ